ncbi:MAG: SDR family NAD(P)-dependent oxidoreductase, partial [Bryobacteraceae bacterium]
MPRLSDKAAIVTGGAHGIGRAIAEVFAAEGAWVLIADVDDEAGSAAVSAIDANGGAAAFLKTDVSSSEEVERAVHFVVQKNGRIDVLCNNAAYLGEFHAIVESTPLEWDKCIGVALLGTHNFTKAVLPHMMTRRQGS